jgi:hypothetical protein
MSTKNQDSNLSMRILGIIIGITIFIWLSFEDKNETIAIILAIIINSWIAIVFTKHNQKQSQLNLIYFMILGLLVGASVAPMTLFLMAFKTGLHSHLIPEYTNIQINSIIRRIPVWIVGSIFVSLGLGLLYGNSRNFKDSINASGC